MAAGMPKRAAAGCRHEGSCQRRAVRSRRVARKSAGGQESQAQIGQLAGVSVIGARLLMPRLVLTEPMLVRFRRVHDGSHHKSSFRENIVEGSASFSPRRHRSSDCSAGAARHLRGHRRAPAGPARALHPGGAGDVELCAACERGQPVRPEAGSFQPSRGELLVEDMPRNFDRRGRCRVGHALNPMEHGAWP